MARKTVILAYETEQVIEKIGNKFWTNRPMKKVLTNDILLL